MGEFQKNVDSYEDDEADEHQHHQPCDSDERPGLAAVGGGEMGGAHGGQRMRRRGTLYTCICMYIYIYIYVYIT